MALVERFEPSSNGRGLAGAWALERALQEAMASFFSVLDRYTFADLVARPRDRRQLLRLFSISESEARQL